jgi:hypothetical protein
MAYLTEKRFVRQSFSLYDTPYVNYLNRSDRSCGQVISFEKTPFWLENARTQHVLRRGEAVLAGTGTPQHGLWYP